MRVLVACEESGIVRDAFRAQGHDAWSCDLQECSGDDRFHYRHNVIDVMADGWDMMIGHPPCTYMANSGVRWMYGDDGSQDNGRRRKCARASNFFYALWESNIPLICLENPIPHRYAGLPHYTQCVQPWQFGDNFSKATCLWLQGLPPLVPSVLRKPDSVAHACHLEPPGPDRAKNRSKTYPGIAAAMALQWGTDYRPGMELVA